MLKDLQTPLMGTQTRELGLCIYRRENNTVQFSPHCEFWRISCRYSLETAYDPHTRVGLKKHVQSSRCWRSSQFCKRGANEKKTRLKHSGMKREWTQAYESLTLIHISIHYRFVMKSQNDRPPVKLVVPKVRALRALVSQRPFPLPDYVAVNSIFYLT